MTRMHLLPLLLLCCPLSLRGEDNSVSDIRRTVVLGFDEELSREWERFKSMGEAERDRVLTTLVRKGREALVAIPGEMDLRYFNARDLALQESLKQPAQSEERARRALSRAGTDPERLEKILERYPCSAEAALALGNLLMSDSTGRVRREWRGLLPRLDPEVVQVDKTREGIYLPASETYCEELDFPVPVTGDFLLSRGFFRRRRPPLPHVMGPQAELPELARFPQSYLALGANDLILADYRGLIRQRSGRQTSFQIFEIPDPLLIQLDNNLIGDLTLVGEQLLTSQRTSPQIRDREKNLYVVELSRQGIFSFRLNQGLMPHERYERTFSWAPEWSLLDAHRTCNVSVAVRGKTGYTTGTSLAGLFNADLVAFDIDTGKPLWIRPLASGQHELNYFGRHVREAAAGIPLVTDEALFATSNFGTVHCLDLSGRPLWVTRYPRVPTPIPVQYYAMVQPRLSRFRNQMPRLVDGRLYIAPTDSDSLLCLDAATGQLLWSHHLHDPMPGNYPHEEYWIKAFWHVSPRGLIFLDRNTLRCLDPVSGAIKATRHLDPRTLFLGRPLVCRNILALTSADKILLFDRDNLDAKGVLDLKLFGIQCNQANLFYDGHNLVLIDTEGNIHMMTAGAAS